MLLHPGQVSSKGTTRKTLGFFLSLARIVPIQKGPSLYEQRMQEPAHPHGVIWK